MEKLDSAKHYANNYTHILDDYLQWVEVGMSLADLGEPGRVLFHQVSNGSSKYEVEECDKKFTSLSDKHNGSKKIETFFHHCNKELGMAPPVSSNGKAPVKPAKPVKHKKVENKIHTLEDVWEAPEEVYFWKYITAGEINILAGKGGVYKSTLLKNLIQHIVMLEPEFLGWELKGKRGNVVCISTEEGLTLIKDGYKDLIKKGEVDPSQIRFILSKDNIIKDLDRALTQVPGDLVTLDALGDVLKDYGGTEARGIMDELLEVCRKHKATLLILAHTSQSGGNIFDQNSVKGEVDMVDKPRSVMMLARLKETNEIYFACVKNNSIPPHEREYCHHLTFENETRKVSIHPLDEMTIMEFNYRQAKDTVPPNTIEIDWNKILPKGETMKYGELVEAMKEATGIADRTAANKIKRELESPIGELEKDSNNHYIRKDD